MRISSNLTDDNLYNRRHRPSVGGSPSRRLFRLALAMVLVIAVMRQAGNPRIYQVFFSPAEPPPGRLLMERSPGTSVKGTSSGSGRSTDADADVDVTVDTDADAAIRRGRARLAVDSLSDEQAKNLFGLLARLPGDGTAPSESAEDPSIADDFAGLDRWLSDWWRPPAVVELQAALDRWALDRVDRSSVWKASDTVAFYRFLDPAAVHSLRDDSAVSPGVISLLQQPETYLRSRVKLGGTVARAIRREAADNPFDIDHYWELWVRPLDGSERPWVLFTTQVSEQIAAVGPDQTLIEGPAIRADGVYLKRLAYRSAAGSDLAPAVVGFAESLQRPQPVSTVGDDQPQRPSGWLLVLLAAVIGVSIAGFLLRQSRREAKSLRRNQPSSIDLHFGGDDPPPSDSTPPPARSGDRDVGTDPPGIP